MLCCPCCAGRRRATSGLGQSTDSRLALCACLADSWKRGIRSAATNTKEAPWVTAIEVGAGVVERYLDCLAAHDWDGLADHHRRRGLDPRRPVLRRRRRQGALRCLPAQSVHHAQGPPTGRQAGLARRQPRLVCRADRIFRDRRRPCRVARMPAVRAERRRPDISRQRVLQASDTPTPRSGLFPDSPN